MQDIKLTVLVPTYNQEDCIEECINSILMQKTNFAFEVLIGEDCSTDGTKLPEHFKIFYREKNLGIGAYGNTEELLLHGSGKYVIQIEGDDFWTYEYKLQEQVDFLEAHPDYVAVAHNCVVVGADSKPNGEKYVDCKDEEYTYKHYVNDILLGQTASVIYSREFYKYYDVFMQNYKEYEFYPGDRLRAFLLLTMGKVKCIQQTWSAYRHVTTEGSSYSATVPEDEKFKKNQLLFFKNLHTYSKNEKKMDAIIPSGKVYYMFLFKRCWREKDFKDFFHEIFEDDHSWTYLFFVMRRGFKFIVKRMLKKER